MFARIVAAILLVAASLPTLASDELAPGKPVTIKDGNGILAINTEALAFANSVHIERVGSLFGGTTLTHLGGSPKVRLLELAPGDYRLSRIDLIWAGSYLRVPDLPHYRFKIDAGVINYPGDVETAVTARGLYRFHSVNRSARMMVELDRAFPGAGARYPLRYQGAFPDTFPEFARRELGTQSADDALKAAEKGQIKEVDKDADPALKPLIDELFARPQMQRAHMNLAGDLVATIEFRDGKHRVSLIDMRNDIAVDIYRGVNSVEQIRWADDRTLLITLDATSDNNYVARITATVLRRPRSLRCRFPAAAIFSTCFRTIRRTRCLCTATARRCIFIASISPRRNSTDCNFAANCAWTAG